MKCESRLITSFIALRRAQTLAAALLVSAIFIGTLGAAVSVMQVQQAALAAPAGSRKAAPPPKAEIPPPAESSTELLANIHIAPPPTGPFSASLTTALIKIQSDNREFPKFTPERKL